MGGSVVAFGDQKGSANHKDGKHCCTTFADRFL